jgi:uncharacterized membrane protein
MKPFLISVAATIVSMLAIDSVWLRTMYSRFYQPKIGHLLGDTVNYGPAAVFYLIYGVGLTLLVIQPALASASGFGRIFLMGAVYGIVAYGTYDLTNQATLRDWPVMVTIIDIIWGALLTGTVAVIASWVTQKLG